MYQLHRFYPLARRIINLLHDLQPIIPAIKIRLHLKHLGKKIVRFHIPARCQPFKK